MRRLKIAHLTPYYLPSIGGVEYVTQYLAEGLVERGHSVDVLTTRRCNQKGFKGCSSFQETINGVRVYRYRSLISFGHMSLFPAVWQRLQREQYHIVHMHSLRHPHTFIGGWYGLKSGCATILHGHAHFMARNPFKNAVYQLADAVLFRTCYRTLSGVVAITESEKEGYIRRGVAETKIEVILNGVSENYFQPATPDSFRRKHLLPATPMILFIGRIHHSKRIDLIIRALPEIKKQIKDVIFVAVGPDQGWIQYYRRMALELGVNEIVRFTGRVDPTEVPEAIAAADILIIPSDYEAFGLVIVEAMACGKPVIATRSAGPSEIIRHGETGYLVEPGDYAGIAQCSVHLLKNPILSRQMGEFGRRTALRKYRINDIIDQLESFYLKHVDNLKMGSRYQ